MIEEIQQQITNLYMIKIEAMNRNDFSKALEATKLIWEAEKALTALLKINAYLIEELWPNTMVSEE